MNKNLWLITLLLTFNYGISQRDTIRLINPSFEGKVQQGGMDFTGINGWFDCGSINFPVETPPDIHPNGYWENNLPASDKNTYLGMVVRDNGSYESVSTRLEKPLKAGNCYKFSIHLARAERYISMSRITHETANYTTPAVLRIWGGNGFCDERELLAESAPVNNTSWQINTFEFKPSNDIRSLTFSVYYKTPVVFPYNGNLLVDGSSDIIRIQCPGDAPLKDVVTNLPPHKKTNKPRPATNKTDSSPVASASKPKINTEKFTPKVMVELHKDKLKEGQTIEIKKLFFTSDSSTINKSSYDVLDEIYAFLMSNNKIVIEIGGHTNNIPSDDYCNKLSTARAKSVAEYLINKGVNPEKVQFKGYGKKKPIADNRTQVGRSRNQRVEIKILNID